MARDSKYGEVVVEDGEHTPFGDDEPIFIFRGKDSRSVAALKFYAALTTGDADEIYAMIDEVVAEADTGGRDDGSSPQFSAQLSNTILLFDDWQKRNPGAVGVPD